jgi:hypothetical protein
LPSSPLCAFNSKQRWLKDLFSKSTASLFPCILHAGLITHELVLRNKGQLWVSFQSHAAGQSQNQTCKVQPQWNRWFWLTPSLCAKSFGASAAPWAMVSQDPYLPKSPLMRGTVFSPAQIPTTEGPITPIPGEFSFPFSSWAFLFFSYQNIKPLIPAPSDKSSLIASVGPGMEIKDLFREGASHLACSLPDLEHTKSYRP